MLGAHFVEPTARQNAKLPPFGRRPARPEARRYTVSALALQPGSELDRGKYRIIRLLGEGGMGSVYEAEHTLTHKRVAIKWMHPSVAAASGSARLVRAYA